MPYFIIHLKLFNPPEKTTASLTWLCSKNFFAVFLFSSSQKVCKDEKFNCFQTSNNYNTLPGLIFSILLYWGATSVVGNEFFFQIVRVSGSVCTSVCWVWKYLKSTRIVIQINAFIVFAVVGFCYNPSSTVSTISHCLHALEPYYSFKM